MEARPPPMKWEQGGGGLKKKKWEGKGEQAAGSGVAVVKFGGAAETNNYALSPPAGSTNNRGRQWERSAIALPWRSWRAV
jgi:hypothetical protein